MYTMNSVNWVEAKRLYITDSRYSYRKLATTYGVSKAVIQKRATKEGWAIESRQFTDDIIKETLRLSKEDIAEINARHIRMLKVAQAEAYRALVAAYNPDSSYSKHKPSAADMRKSTDALLKLIKQERKILGISPVLKDKDENVRNSTLSLLSRYNQRV